jgi:hypothetical protein
MQSKQGKALRGVSLLLLGVFALVTSVDLAPEAEEILLARGHGDTSVWIANVYYSCIQGNSLAMVRNGTPDSSQDYSLVKAKGLSVYVPKEMSFENDIPWIVAFTRKTGLRDAGVRNAK